MRYTVVYLRTARNQLANIWTVASDRAAVTAAANRFDRVLATDPHLVGESRSGATRVLLEHPLGALFEVSQADRLATVVAIWRIR
jgi:hypothetical protein